MFTIEEMFVKKKTSLQTSSWYWRSFWDNAQNYNPATHRVWNDALSRETKKFDTDNYLSRVDLNRETKIILIYFSVCISSLRRLQHERTRIKFKSTTKFDFISNNCMTENHVHEIFVYDRHIHRSRKRWFAATELMYRIEKLMLLTWENYNPYISETTITMQFLRRRLFGNTPYITILHTGQVSIIIGNRWCSSDQCRSNRGG